MNPKLKNIFAQLEKENLQLLIVSSPYNISYLTNFPGRDSCLLISKKKNIFFTDSRYFERAKISLKKTIKVVKINAPISKMIADSCKNLRVKRVGFEEKSLNFGEYQRLKQALSQNINFVPTSNLIEKQRELKGREEIRKVKEATRITILAFRFIKGFLKPGIKEIEIAAELERFIRYNGAQASAFDIIVASGQNSTFPHHVTSSKRMGNNEPVLIDVGVEYLGYKSDLTRVFFLGKINTLYGEIYKIVLGAQAEAIAKIKPSVPVSLIDASAREYIVKKGYGEYFGHALGHGIGLEIHEAPRVNKENNGLLRAGMILTIEPAIYIPGKFGVRLEDMVLVTEKGCVVLSGALNK
jgi:Xaa-Pro aminopeptidase